MKKVLILLLFSINISLFSATYYVSPSGNDGAAGTIDAPWKSWNYAINRLVAGDILYVRGGTYTVMGGQLSGNYVGARAKLKATQNAQITVSAYPGDTRPILDCSSLSSVAGYRRGILMENCSYWNFKGLTVKSVREYSGSPTSYTGSGWEIVDSDHITLDNCAVTDCMEGFDVNGTVTNLSYINCDAYDNYDIYQGGDLCNGFSGNARGASSITYVGCRSWRNSDDGYDNLGGSGSITYINCWAFNNGPWHGGDAAGNGCGFKLATDNTNVGGTRTMYNCLAVSNKHIGIEGQIESGPPFTIGIYNCVSANNGDYYGFRVPSSSTYGTATLRNNISYGSSNNYSGGSQNIADHNTWNLAVTPNNEDFSSVDYTQLTGARGSDGSLPLVNAFHLISGSDLTGKGSTTGIYATDGDGEPWAANPALGAFEFKTGSAIPSYSSSAIENATPSLLSISYDRTLANIVPAASAFSVMVNSVPRNVTSIAISGNKVQLTLSAAVVYGDLVAVSYTVPSSNPLQTASGDKAASISAQRVTNNVSPIGPDYISSSVENANPSLLIITYNMTLANVVPSTSAFSVKVNSSTRSVSKVSISASTVQLTLASAVVYGDAVTVAYTKPSSNPLQSSTGGQASTLSAQKVTNNVSPASPVYVSSAIQNAIPSLLEMTYNLSLANVVPAASAFSVVVNSTKRTVSSVAISGTKVQLTLSMPVVYGDVVTVAYTRPSSNPLQTASGAQAATLSAQKVTNNVSSGSPVYVSSSVENTNPSALLINFDLTLANVVPSTSAFSVKVNSNTRTLTAVSVSGTRVQLTLSSAVIYGDVITVAYTKPSGNPLQTSAGGQVATFTAQKVTNNVNPIYPVYVSSVVENANPSFLIMTYSLALANVVPPASAFTVMVNSVARAVTTVTVSGTKVQLALSSPVIKGDAVTIAYTKPASNPLQTSSGLQVFALSAQKVTNNVIAANPVYASSSVENTNPSALVINFDLALANVVPATSAFSVKVNSNTRTLTAVSVSGTKVQLSLLSAVVYGDVITVAYTKPSANPLQTSLGGQVATFSSKTVTNNISPVYPVYVSSVVENANPYLVTMTYSIALANVVPAASAFTVKVNSAARTVSTVSVSGTKVQLALSGPVVSDDIVTVAYTKPASKPLQSLLGIQAVTISSQAVTNNTINVPPAIAIISPANNSEFKTSTNITITANATDADGTIASVELYNGTTLLGSLSAAPYSFTWNSVAAGTYSLTAIATDSKNARTTSSAISITVKDEPIIVNQSPVIMISSPTKGEKYDDPADIYIDIIASDPDGTISKVELYNGTTRLIELTAEPYSYAWKGVTAGTYTITAVATDNSNATTTSAPIEFLIGKKTTYDPNGDFINLYPNPNNGQFTINVVTPLQSEKSEIIITDLSGNKLYSEPILREETSKQFDVSFFKPGIYIMSVIDNEILITKKFIKK
jgi:uncharacterized repeat protein (TIGR02059 family)